MGKSGLVKIVSTNMEVVFVSCQTTMMGMAGTTLVVPASNTSADYLKR